MRLTKRIKTYMFDFDGVIANTGLDIANSVRHILYEYNFKTMSNEDIWANLGLGSGHLIKMCSGLPDGPELDAIIADYMDYYLHHSAIETTLTDGLLTLLDFLKNKSPNPDLPSKAFTAVVTNKPESISKEILDKFNISSCFDMLVGPESLDKLKPDPEGINMVLAAAKCRPDEAIMIGDMPTDIKAGKAAGVVTVGRYGGFCEEDELEAANPDYLIRDLDEIMAIEVG